jgi:hypothetical protein
MSALLQRCANIRKTLENKRFEIRMPNGTEGKETIGPLLYLKIANSGLLMDQRNGFRDGIQTAKHLVSNALFFANGKQTWKSLRPTCWRWRSQNRVS